MINIVYFAKYREAVGVGREQYDLAQAADLASLREAIRARHGSRAAVFLEDPRCVVAINQQVAKGNPVLEKMDEVAFFPPVTGG